LIELVGYIGIGVLIGFVTGMVVKKFEDPRITAYRQALEATEMHYKESIARMRNRLREYEQPRQMQQIASMENVGFDQLIDELANLPQIPKYLRPIISRAAPAIKQWAQENPDQVEALTQQLKERFLGKGQLAESEGLL
jgi:hypothetical protein